MTSTSPAPNTPSNTNTPLTPVILSISVNGTKSLTKGIIDCAKDCPCGVAAIPVPDQWLEVMVSGGFKVWHIIFIIIALVVGLIVVYCCFHRCRIPRTKQEIEADLMRSNMTNKFREYLQELPNEPITFVEVLKRVQDLEEKLEKEDAEVSRETGARKRMGWLKLKGKNTSPQNGIDIEAGQATVDPNVNEPKELLPDNPEKSTVISTALDPITATKQPNEQLLSDIERVTKAASNPPETTINIDNNKPTTLNVESGSKQHRKTTKHHNHDSSKAKRNSPVSETTRADNNNMLISNNNDDSQQTLTRRRKHDKPNLSRSKMVRGKSHPSFDGLANDHVVNKKEEEPTTNDHPVQNAVEPTKINVETSNNNNNKKDEVEKKKKKKTSTMTKQNEKKLPSDNDKSSTPRIVKSHRLLVVDKNSSKSTKPKSTLITNNK